MNSSTRETSSKFLFEFENIFNFSIFIELQSINIILELYEGHGHCD